MAALWSLRPTAVDACVNLQAQRLFVSRFRNNINFTAAVLVMSFEKLGDLLFENKTSCLTNVLLDHFRLVRVWFWESHHLWEGGAVDCSGLDLLIVCISVYVYIWLYETTVTFFFGVVHTLHLADIFSFSTLQSKRGFMDLPSSSREVYFFKGLVVAPCDRWFFYLDWKKQGKQKGTSLVRKRNVIQPFNRSGAAIDQFEKTVCT